MIEDVDDHEQDEPREREPSDGESKANNLLQRQGCRACRMIALGEARAGATIVHAT
jgi:hypothetical protein